MAQILDVNSPIYFENGGSGSGWYIIPAGFDIEDPAANGRLVETQNNILVYSAGSGTGLTISGSVDIYLIYSADLFKNDANFINALRAIENTQSSNNPAKILLTNDYQFTDYEVPIAYAVDKITALSHIFIINADVPITNITHSEPTQTVSGVVTSHFDISITFQNEDGSTGTWVIDQAETSITFGNKPAQIDQNSQFQIGADGDVLTARAFITACESATPYFDDDTYFYNIDENLDDFDLTQAISAKSSVNLALVTDYQLAGAPAGFSINNAGVISYNGNGFDYETAPENGYVFSVIATAPNGKTATSTVTVFVDDVEEPLVISIATTGGGATIAENIADGSNANVQNLTVLLNDPEDIYAIEAADVTVFEVDDNSISPVFEAILSGDSSKWSASVTLHKLDGVTIDHETKSSYNLEIRALDEEGNIVSEQVTVQVTNLHDPGPVLGPLIQ